VAKERLCRLDELAPGTARRFDVGEHRVAVVRIGDDVYAVGDRCTHENISLAEGDVYEDDKTLECWKHGSEFSLETGEALTLPATKPTPVYDVRVDDGDVVVVTDD
jgi:3-phenylpropionate/trans-cinnamate dioxygenase ferredoxin subunit